MEKDLPPWKKQRMSALRTVWEKPQSDISSVSWRQFVAQALMSLFTTLTRHKGWIFSCALETRGRLADHCHCWPHQDPEQKTRGEHRRGCIDISASQQLRPLWPVSSTTLAFTTILCLGGARPKEGNMGWVWNLDTRSPGQGRRFPSGKRPP
jgi:hypothetical protein